MGDGVTDTLIQPAVLCRVSVQHWLYSPCSIRHTAVLGSSVPRDDVLDAGVRLAINRSTEFLPILSQPLIDDPRCATFGCLKVNVTQQVNGVFVNSPDVLAFSI